MNYAFRVRRRGRHLLAKLDFFLQPFVAGARRRLMAMGLPLRREYLVLRCMEEGYGLFTEFTFVMAALHHYETTTGCYAGLKVAFTGQGHYYDRAAGEDWWRYCFEPVEIGSAHGAVPRELDNADNLFPVLEDANLTRTAAAAIIQRHIRIQPILRERIDAFVRDRFGTDYVVGVHYRGTDKAGEAPRLPYDRITSAVHDAARLAASRPWRLFVATDEQAFLEHARASFPGRVVSQDTIRSTDGRGLHFQLAGNRRSAEDAVMDCVLLSRCDQLLRTDSELSLCSTFFNPDLPVTELGPT